MSTAEETQARAELLATMVEANAAGNLSLLREALQLLTTLTLP
jgi:hypothetical protein